MVSELSKSPLSNKLQRNVTRDYSKHKIIIIIYSNSYESPISNKTEKNYNLKHMFSYISNNLESNF